MLQDVLKYITKGNACFGVEVNMQNGDYKYTVIGVEKSKKSLNLTYQKAEVEVKDLAKTIGKAKPVFVVINTSDVITKQIKSVSKDDNVLLNEAFPNLSIEAFYYEILKQEETIFISICRKYIVDNLIKKLSDENIFVIDFSLGTLIVSNTLKFIKTNSELIVSNAKVSLKNEQIGAIEKELLDNPVSYDINGLQVSSAYVLGFSGALSLVLENNILSNNYQQEQLELHEEFRNQRILKLGVSFSIGIVFIGLLVNFLFFNHYFSEVNELKDISQFMMSSNDKVSELSAKVMKSKKMILDVQHTADSKASFYIDAIVHRLPSTINLKELNYQPLDKRIEAKKPIVNNRGEIVISGNSIDSIDYSAWLSELEALEWVHKVDILSYESITQNKSGFSIKIKINEEV